MDADTLHVKDTPLIRELYYQFGIAAHWGQKLEKEICDLLLLPEFKRSGQFDVTTWDRTWERLNKDTLGCLCKKLAQHFKLVPSFQQLLDDSLERRNQLVHGFFSKNAQQLLDESSLPKLIQELKETAFYLQETMLAIQPYNKQLREMGRAAKVVNERYSKVDGKAK